MAYLRTFDTVQGASEILLRHARTILGREREFCDHTLSHVTVSRLHAILLRDEGEFHVIDAASSAGTFVNGERVRKATLAHGDMIQLGSVILEFRTDDEACYDTNAENLPDTPENRLRDNYRLLPACIQLRYRPLQVDPKRVFSTGDTVNLRQGGMMIPRAPGELGNVVLEIELTWPDGRQKVLLGEIMGSVDYQYQLAYCVKLHDISRERYERMMERIKRGSWIVAS